MPGLPGSNLGLLFCRGDGLSTGQETDNAEFDPKDPKLTDRDSSIG